MNQWWKADGWGLRWHSSCLTIKIKHSLVTQRCLVRPRGVSVCRVCSESLWGQICHSLLWTTGLAGIVQLNSDLSNVKPQMEIEKESPSVRTSRGKKSTAMFHNAEWVGWMYWQLMTGVAELMLSGDRNGTFIV